MDINSFMYFTPSGYIFISQMRENCYILLERSARGVKKWLFHLIFIFVFVHAYILTVDQEQNTSRLKFFKNDVKMPYVEACTTGVRAVQACIARVQWRDIVQASCTGVQWWPAIQALSVSERYRRAAVACSTYTQSWSSCIALPWYACTSGR